MKTGVVVPIRNGGQRWLACLAALARQRPRPVALVAVDSGSTDGSDVAAERAGATVLRIAPEEFDHGETRNRGARALPAGLDAIVFTVQDAVALGQDCLDTLARAACTPGTGAASARQVAPADAGWLTASTVAASPFAAETPVRTGPFAREQLAALGAEDWRPLLELDDVFSAVRAPLFAAGGFRRTMHGEDALLAYDLLWAGWALQHEPAACVEHGHDYDKDSVAPRYRADAIFFRKAFGWRVRPDLLSVLKGVNAELRRDRQWLSAHGRNGERSMKTARELRWAQVLAQREGSQGPLGRLPVPLALPTPAELGCA